MSNSADRPKDADTLSQSFIDQAHHLAGLLIFTGQIASAIRMYTAYNQSGSGLEEFAPGDVMFLSDTLVNFEFLGEYVAAGDSTRVIELCNKLGPTLAGYIGQHVFARNPRVNLHSAIDHLAGLKGVFEELSRGERLTHGA